MSMMHESVKEPLQLPIKTDREELRITWQQEKVIISSCELGFNYKIFE